MPFRILFISALILFAPPFHAFAATPDIKVVGELKVDGLLAMTVDDSGTMYVATEEGIKVFTSDGDFVRTIQKEQAEKPLLRKPSGIAVSGNKVYVTDTSEDRLYVFTKEGDLLFSFGVGGGDPKEFDDPEGIFVNQGVIYIADTDNGRVQVFGPNGIFQGAFGSMSIESWRLDEPIDVVVAPTGNVYVSDAGRLQVIQYRPDGTYGGTLNGVSEPGNIAISHDGLFVADLKDCRVHKYDFQGKKLFSFGSKGKGRAQFLKFSGIAVDGSGRVYVADSKTNRIQVFELGMGENTYEPLPPITSATWTETTKGKGTRLLRDKGNSLIALDDSGQSLHFYDDGKLQKTLDLKGVKSSAAVVDANGGIWVADYSGGKILKLGGNGQVMAAISSKGGGEGYLSKPVDLAVTGKGLVYVADWGNDRVQVFNTDGVFLRVLGDSQTRSMMTGPVRIEIGSGGEIFVLDDDSKRVFLFSNQEKFKKTIGADASCEYASLKEPVDMAINGTELFVLDRDGGHVKVFDMEGNFVRVFGAEGGEDGDFSDPVAIEVIDEITLVVSEKDGERFHFYETAYTPSDVKDLRATGGMRSVSLEWSPNNEHYIDTYRILRYDEVMGRFAEIARIDGTSFTDAGLLPDVQYRYRVVASARRGNESAMGETVSALALKSRVPSPENLAIETEEWSARLSWDPVESEFFSHYAVYRQTQHGLRKIAETKEPSFLESPLESATEYIYRVVAVSNDGIESDPVIGNAKTLVATRPPLEVDVLEMGDIFSNAYKSYESDGIAEVRIINNTPGTIEKLKVTVFIKDFMDFPSELDVEELEPKSSHDLTLKAVFNNRILEITEDTPVQVEIALCYYKNQEPCTFSKNLSVNVFEKHRLSWDVKERFAAFVTPKDPVILEFVRSIVTQYPEISDSLRQGAVLFDALGIVGLKYLPDPSNPYQMTSEMTDYVDYIQYPRETLQRRSGDCDDLVGLYSAMLESIGVRTMVLETPGHMFMMFDTALSIDKKPETMAPMFVEHEDTLWIPVEVTLVGASFLKAWETGARTVGKYSGKELGMMDIRASWDGFKPASLPSLEWRPETVLKSVLDAQYDDRSSLDKIRLRLVGNTYYIALKKNSDDVEALLQLAILAASEGQIEEALEHLRKAETLVKDDARILTNLGNIHYIKEEFETAFSYYNTASTVEPGDAHLLVSLARCQIRLSKKAEAAEVFKRALEIDPSIAQTYRMLSFELMEAL